MKQEDTMITGGVSGRSGKWFTTRLMVSAAILSAISAVLFYFPEFPVPLMPPWMKLDLSNLPALIGAFALGPWAGAVIVAVKDLLGLTHSTSGGVGELADFLISIAFIVPASLLYWKRKNRGGALIGMAAGTAGMVAAACLTNYYILIPMFSRLFMPLDQILAVAAQSLPGVRSLWTYVLWVVIPFNLVKGALISAVTFLLYKRLSPILHGRKA